MTKAIQSVALSERVNAPRHAFKLVIPAEIALKVLAAFIVSFSFLWPLFFHTKGIPTGVLGGITFSIFGLGLWVWSKGENLK